MVDKDKAFWVDKPGANAYTLHDAYYSYGMTTEKVLPGRCPFYLTGFNDRNRNQLPQTNIT